MSLTNPNTPVSQQDLQDFYHKLLPYMGGSFGLVATGIDSANLYSTTERVIGQWIDGKPLYQKVVEFTITNNNTWTDYNHGISNIEKCVSMDCFAVYNGEVYTVGPKHNDSFITGFFGKTSVSVSSKNYTNYTARCILRYTKTTDSAVESYGTDTTYSTDEHVVGSWIDGSPVYQAVVQFTPIVSSGNAWHETDADISGLHIGFMISSPVMSVKGSYPAICEVHTNGKLRFMHFRGSDSPTIKGAILQYVKSTS